MASELERRQAEALRTLADPVVQARLLAVGRKLSDPEVMGLFTIEGVVAA